ncbi:MAG: hypothetical protein Q7S79_00910 [bacterium]|nr:hypothetical protein [bacterium]
MKLLTTLLVILFAISLIFVKELPVPVKADTGAPLTITAEYNSTTGQLNTSGTYVWEECEPGEETNILGFALFINGGNPAVNDSNALDGSAMHLTNGGNPCTETPGNWGDINHVLSSAPTTVCAVVYDVRADDSADPEGIHSLIGAGGNYNADNSWNLNGNSFQEGSCVAPTITSSENGGQCDEGQVFNQEEEKCVPKESPSPTPLVVLETPFPQPCNGCGDQSDGRSPSGGTGGGQVLGAAVEFAATGVAEDIIVNVLGGIGTLLTLAGAVVYAKAKNG